MQRKSMSPLRFLTLYWRIQVRSGLFHLWKCRRLTPHYHRGWRLWWCSIGRLIRPISLRSSPSTEVILNMFSLPICCRIDLSANFCYRYWMEWVLDQAGPQSRPQQRLQWFHTRSNVKPHPVTQLTIMSSLPPPPRIQRQPRMTLGKRRARLMSPALWMPGGRYD